MELSPAPLVAGARGCGPIGHHLGLKPVAHRTHFRLAVIPDVGCGSAGLSSVSMSISTVSPSLTAAGWGLVATWPVMDDARRCAVPVPWGCGVMTDCCT